jgi:Rv0078B-related antitoxin
MTGRPGWSRLSAMDALLAHDREHARQLDPAERLRQALDVMRAGIRLKRSTLRRQFPGADETEVDQRLARWLRGDD